MLVCYYEGMLADPKEVGVPRGRCLLFMVHLHVVSFTICIVVIVPISKTEKNTFLLFYVHYYSLNDKPFDKIF